ncbi:MAG: phenylpyruvate tautomerase MIF-related protein [Gammaproteobacteria bacterium]
MPLLLIESNQSVDDLQLLLTRMSATVSKALGKPESYVMVKYLHNSAMLFAGTNDPLAYLELKSIGLPETETGPLSKQLTTLVSELLNIPSDRVYIEFTGVARHLWGWKGSTF